MNRKVQSLAVLAGVGSLGLIALIVDGIINPTQYEELAAEAGISMEFLLLAAAVQVFILMGLAIVVGLWAAPKLGFESHLVSRVTDGQPLIPAVASEWKPALGVGGAIGALLVTAEAVAPEIPNGEAYEMTVELLVQSIPLRLFYGGITEELLLRWGVMSLIALLAWKVLGTRGKQPSEKVVWSAIIISAVLFGVAHLPMAANIYGALTTEVLLFIVGANTIGGIGFGWLFWRYSLEAAMVAHAFAHVVAVSVWVVLLLV